MQTRAQFRFDLAVSVYRILLTTTSIAVIAVLTSLFGIIPYGVALYNSLHTFALFFTVITFLFSFLGIFSPRHIGKIGLAFSILFIFILLALPEISFN